MAKKRLWLGMLAVTLAFGMTDKGFALPEFQLSAGGGATVEWDLLAMVYDGPSSWQGFRVMPGFGGFVFFNATYLEASIGVSGGTLEYFRNLGGNTTGIELSGSFAALNFSLLGKYPFVFGKFSIFPMAGIDYQLFLSAEIEGHEYNEPSELNVLWFKVGVGGDFALTEKLYLRGAALFDFSPFSNKFANDISDNVPGASSPDLSWGATIKLAVGYKF